MRVLHFAGSFPPTPGGTSQRVAGLTADPRNEHLIIVPNGGQENPNRERVDHRDVQRVTDPRALQSRVPILRDRSLAAAFVCAAKAYKPDILHAHNPMACALASLQYKRQTGIPMVYEAHGIMCDLSYDQPIFGPIKPLNQLAQSIAKRTARIRERAVLLAADHIIAQTASSAKRLQTLYDLGDKPIDVIYNGVDAKWFDPLRWKDDRDEIRKNCGWDGRKVILYAGFLNKVNGVDFLLDCIDQMAKNPIEGVRFAILGRGPLESLVRSAASKHPDLISFEGSVAPEQMPAYYAACDVFTIPRPASILGEIFLPMKLLEAMAMAKTLVVSDVAAMADVIGHQQNGLIFCKGNQADYIKALNLAIGKNKTSDDVRKLHGLGIQARADILDRFTWQASREALQSVYDSVLTGCRTM